VLAGQLDRLASLTTLTTIKVGVSALERQLPLTQAAVSECQSIDAPEDPLKIRMPVIGVMID